MIDFSNSSMRNNWFIGCASAQLGDVPFATEILGHKLVIYRDSTGRPMTLKDRCCHRGFALSKGKVIGNNIQCGFHGWQFDKTGQCVRIPSQSPEKPIAKSYTVPSLPCEEQDGYIWIWMGTADSTAIPTIKEFSHVSWVQGSRIVNCNFVRALEITFDASHLYFAHPTHPVTIAAAQFGMSEQKSEIRLTETGCIVFSPPTRYDSDSIPETAGSMEFLLPDRVRFVAPSTKGNFYMNFHVVPVRENICRIEYLVQNFNPKNSNADLIWSDGPSDIIEEDVFMLENSQYAYESEGFSFERSTEADLTSLTLRKITSLFAEGKWFGENSDLPKRQIASSMGPTKFGWN